MTDPYALAREICDRVAPLLTPIDSEARDREGFAAFFREAIALRILADPDHAPMDSEVIEYVHWVRHTPGETISGRGGRQSPIRPLETYRAEGVVIELVRRDRRWLAIDPHTADEIASFGARTAAIGQLALIHPGGTWTRTLAQRDRAWVLARWRAAKEFAQSDFRKKYGGSS